MISSQRLTLKFCTGIRRCSDAPLVAGRRLPHKLRSTFLRASGRIGTCVCTDLDLPVQNRHRQLLRLLEVKPHEKDVEHKR